MQPTALYPEAPPFTPRRAGLGEGRSFAKFVTKFAMLSIFPLREISCEISYAVHFPKPNLNRNSPPWRGKDIVRDRN